MSAHKLFGVKNLSLLFLAFITGILMSPKWTFALATWIHFAVLLRYYRDNNWKGFLLSLPVLTLAGIIAQVEVIPLELSQVVVLMLVLNSINLIPFVIEKLTHTKMPAWAAMFVFPTIYTLYTYFMDAGPQGSWGNWGYTQYEFLSLMQLASLTGIYGINFLICWFASFANYCYKVSSTQKTFDFMSLLMPICFGAAVLFGLYQLNMPSENKGTTKMATLTMDNLSVIKQMYKAETGKSIELPKYFSQGDPIVKEMNKGLIGFMSKPSAPKFNPVYAQMDSVLNNYVLATKEAARAGAKIITWSEAAIINIKENEKRYIDKMASLSAELDIYLFFPTAVFHPEKVGKEELYIENKVLTFNPEGELVNTYFKNIPIMGVEPSFPGDGKIPVIKTPYGKLSPIICYDADHPQLIAQLQNQSTELLVVPSGDWKAISPYHTQMAAVRCIENGVSMIRATSNGLSAMIDDKGRILASRDFFIDEKVKAIIYDMPVRTSETGYALIHPLFIKSLFGMLLLIVFKLLTRRLMRIGKFKMI